MNKKILILDGHPNEQSLCKNLVQNYEKGALSKQHEVKKIVLRDLNFETNLKKGYHEVQELEPDLLQAQEMIQWCEHLVLIYPMWWGMVPALLKGFLDRCFLPGFAFKYHKNDLFWDRLLTGRSARMIVTSDSPYLYNLLVHFNAPYRVVKKMVLEFCGFKPVKLTTVGRVKNLNKTEIENILNKINQLGEKGL